MTAVINADAHVLEPGAMWENFDDGGKMYAARPLLVTLPEDTTWGGRNAFWLIDGECFPKTVGRQAYASHTPTAQLYERERTDIPLGALDMSDIAPRIRDMDARAIDVQVIYPTLFLRFGTDSAELDVAMARAYNRYMAKTCAASQGRLRFVMIPPLRSIEHAIEEINWAKEHGAVGVFFRCNEVDRVLSDHYFDPIYREASKLNLPICIHVGQARNGVYARVTTPMEAFTDIVVSRLPERFPDLRIGFIEFGSMWIPDTMYKIARRSTRMRIKGGPAYLYVAQSRDDAAMFKDYRIYIACFADENLRYVMDYAGEDHLIIGDDYGHMDAAVEERMVDEIRGRTDISTTIADKILGKNAKVFYGL